MRVEIMGDLEKVDLDFVKKNGAVFDWNIKRWCVDSHSISEKQLDIILSKCKKQWTSSDEVYRFSRMGTPMHIYTKKEEKHLGVFTCHDNDVQNYMHTFIFEKDVFFADKMDDLDDVFDL